MAERVNCFSISRLQHQHHKEQFAAGPDAHGSPIHRHLRVSPRWLPLLLPDKCPRQERNCQQFAADFAEISIFSKDAISMPAEDDLKKQVKTASNETATAAIGAVPIGV
jgi:hypothetical protein